MINQQFPISEFDEEVPDMFRDMAVAARIAHDVIMDLSEIHQERVPSFLLIMTSDDRRDVIAFGAASKDERARFTLSMFNSLSRPTRRAMLISLLAELNE